MFTFAVMFIYLYINVESFGWSNFEKIKYMKEYFSMLNFNLIQNIKNLSNEDNIKNYIKYANWNLSEILLLKFKCTYLKLLFVDSDLLISHISVNT